ncbi:MAG TPA: GNAT family N-acetyltransferase [Chitinophagaceae bacterium]|nr:GNAT family N-acetyltransferase [Chitinophagaceae bacterium]
MPIVQATTQDIPALEGLLNNAYRGDDSKQGWTTEADLLEGDLRTDATILQQLMQTPGAVFLKYVDDDNSVKGCVFLHKKEDKLYLGMLSVSPRMQATGIGKQLMAEAERFAKGKDCSSIFMKVIGIRHELVAWYERKGYSKTGETEPFPIDNRFGKPTQPLEFIIMEKKL